MTIHKTKLKKRKITTRKRKNPEPKFKTEFANKKLEYFWKIWPEEVEKILKDYKWRFDIPEDKNLFLLNAYRKLPITGFNITQGSLLTWQERIVKVGQSARLNWEEIDIIVEYLTGKPLSND